MSAPWVRAAAWPWARLLQTVYPVNLCCPWLVLALTRASGSTWPTNRNQWEAHRYEVQSPQEGSEWKDSLWSDGWRETLAEWNLQELTGLWGLFVLWGSLVQRSGSRRPESLPWGNVSVPMLGHSQPSLGWIQEPYACRAQHTAWWGGGPCPTRSSGACWWVTRTENMCLIFELRT